MRKATILLLALLLAVLGGGVVLAQTDAGASEDAETLTSAAFLTMNLRAGFPLDPFVVSLNGGGEIDASTLDPECVGFITEAPTFAVNWRVRLSSLTSSTTVISTDVGLATAGWLLPLQ